jgi:hypothetical protein
MRTLSQHRPGRLSISQEKTGKGGRFRGTRTRFPKLAVVLSPQRALLLARVQSRTLLPDPGTAAPPVTVEDPSTVMIPLIVVLVAPKAITPQRSNRRVLGRPPRIGDIFPILREASLEYRDNIFSYHREPFFGHFYAYETDNTLSPKSVFRHC